MLGTKCPTVRSTGTIRLRSALMPILMTSRASMEFPDRSSGDPGFARCAPRDDAASLLREPVDEADAALHLVDQRRFVDLDDDSLGIDAEVLHQRLGDVAHHADLLLVGAAGGHADGNFGHFFLLLFSFRYRPLAAQASPHGPLFEELDARVKPANNEFSSSTSRHAVPIFCARRSRARFHRPRFALRPASSNIRH